MGASGLDLGKLFDPGALAHAVADAILPPDMEWMGGILGAAIDLQCGNPVGALKEALDVAHDLKDTSLSSPPKKPGPQEPLVGWQYEPSPPPKSTLRATPPQGPSSWTPAPPPVTTNGGSEADRALAKTQASLVKLLGGSTAPPPPAPTTLQPPTAPWRGTPPVPATIGQAVAQMTNTLRQSQPSRAVQDPSTMSKDEFFRMDDEALMRAVRNGTIPKEVSDSESAMKTLQARVTHFSEMNQLISSMILALHQMQMAVIQNVRV